MIVVHINQESASDLLDSIHDHSAVICSYAIQFCEGLPS